MSAGPAALRTALAGELADASNGWSMGVFGALAEFSHLAESATTHPDPLTAINAAGAIRITLPPAARGYAFEALSARADAWQQGVAFGLPAGVCDGPARETLTEVSPDREAIRAQDRDALLFDLGLGMPCCEFLVRTADPALIAYLRSLTGRPLFGGADAAPLARMPEFQPHRVVRSPLGRVEIFQRIPLHGETTPEGPHTHLLPDLVAHRRVHAADQPIPGSLTPCLTLHPANPVRDEHGRARPFDAAGFTRFQTLLDRYGDPALARFKRTVWSAVRTGDAPPRHPPATRAERIACRVALRQLAHLDGESAALAAWLKAFDSGAERRSRQGAIPAPH
ncbi:MAG: DUF6925 family protein [Burkholderiales bacterium]